MKNLLIGLTIAVLFTSCGKVERPDQLFDFLDHDSLENEVDNNSDDIDAISSEIAQIQLELQDLYNGIDSLEVAQDVLEEEILLNNLEIIDLKSRNFIVRTIDPCGDNVNQFDEILVEMSNGDIIAYFEQGGKRFLTVLTNGNYRTTDRQSCNFSIVNGEYQE